MGHFRGTRIIIRGFMEYRKIAINIPIDVLGKMIIQMSEMKGASAFDISDVAYTTLGVYMNMTDLSDLNQYMKVYSEFEDEAEIVEEFEDEV